MAKKRKSFEGDDGRVIANMNVEGMPWYTEKTPASDAPQRREPMSKKESRAYTWAAVKAGLLVWAVFVIVFLIFILICLKAWL